MLDCSYTQMLSAGVLVELGHVLVRDVIAGQAWPTILINLCKHADTDIGQNNSKPRQGLAHLTGT